MLYTPPDMCSWRQCCPLNQTMCGENATTAPTCLLFFWSGDHVRQLRKWFPYFLRGGETNTLRAIPAGAARSPRRFHRREFWHRVAVLQVPDPSGADDLSVATDGRGLHACVQRFRLLFFVQGSPQRRRRGLGDSARGGLASQRRGCAFVGPFANFYSNRG